MELGGSTVYGSALHYIIDLARMKIDAGVAESDIGGIKLGDKARFTVDTYPDRSFEAVVHRPPLVPRMVSDVVTYDVVLKVDNSNLLLKPGMIATVQIITASRSDVLKVPDQALQFLPSGVADPPVLPAGQSRVWVLRDGKPTAVPLKLGLDDHHFSEVIEGDLKPGDKVVVGEDKPLSVINILKQHL